MINLVILTGGRGLEREVSINSANNFAKNVDITTFNVFMVCIEKNGFWLINGEVCAILKKSDSFFLTVGLDEKKIKIDLIFPIIHGEGAENGEVQGFFDTLGFRGCVANSLLSSAISFDKIMSKKLAESLRIPVAPYLTNINDFREASELLKSETLFLKPVDNGSSFGCKKVSNQDELNVALSEISQISKCAVIEKFIDAVECSCSVLYDEISDVICINYDFDFFSHEVKYLDHGFDINILQDNQLVSKIKEYSYTLFKQMSFTLFCRFDFFICKKTGELYFNEANSLPGLGKYSLFFGSFYSKYSEKDIISKIFSKWIEKFKYK